MAENKTGKLEIVGPWQQGLLDQFVTIGWKWRTEIGNFGEAIQMSDMSEEHVQAAKRRMERFGHKWYRKFTSKNRHLWFTIWRQKGQIERLERNIAQMTPTPQHLNLVQRIAWRVIYSEKYD